MHNFGTVRLRVRARDVFITLIKVETVLDNLRPDPRFKQLLKRVNLPE
jgi:hypothetical protein